MDPALKAANEAIDAKRNEIALQKNTIADAESRMVRLQREVADLLAWVETWHHLTGTPLPRATAAEHIEKSEDTKSKRPQNPNRELVAATVADLIRERGHPLSRRELFELLSQRGVIIQGKDPEMVLSTMLWRSRDQIVRLPKFGYWLKHEDYSDAGYWQLDGEELIGVAAKEPEDGVEADEADG